MKIAYFSTEYPPPIYDNPGVYVDSISNVLTKRRDKIFIFAWYDGKLKSLDLFTRRMAAKKPLKYTGRC